MSIEKKGLKFPNRRQFIYWGLGAGLGIGESVWGWQQLPAIAPFRVSSSQKLISIPD